MTPVASPSPTFTNREIADELERMGIGVYDPGYVSSVRNGSRRSSVLTPEVIAKAVRHLSKQRNQK